MVLGGLRCSPLRISTHQLTARVAYAHWVRRGPEPGDSRADWFAAEAEVAAGEHRAASVDVYASSISADWLQALRRAFSHSLRMAVLALLFLPWRATTASFAAQGDMERFMTDYARALELLLTGLSLQAGCGAGWQVTPMRPSVGEDLAQGGGEGVRLAHAAVFAAEESVVAAGEGDGLHSEPFGHRYGRPAGHGRAGLRPFSP